MTSPDTPHYELTAEEVASPEFRKKLCRSGLRMGALIDLCDMALKGFALSEKEPMLERCCKLFGWQGGTVHQATAEIERLLKSKNDGLVWAEKLKAMTEWLDANQSDVWRRGIWDAINDAQNRMIAKSVRAAELLLEAQ